MGFFDDAKQKLGDAKKLYDIQKQAKKIQKELRDILIEASALDGKIVIIFNGEQKVEEVHIDPMLLVADKVKELEKGVKDAIAQGLSKSQQVATEKMKSVAGDLGIPGL